MSDRTVWKRSLVTPNEVFDVSVVLLGERNPSILVENGAENLWIGLGALVELQEFLQEAQAFVEEHYVGSGAG